MPKAKPPLPIRTPHPLTDEETSFIKETVARYYGANAVIRNFGPNPKILELHIEASDDIGMEFHECVGFIMTKIVRDNIQVCFTRRGAGVRVTGEQKIAYRQGIVI